MGGKIDVKSKVGEGSVFTVHVPSVPICRDCGDGEEPEDINIRFESASVIVADDDIGRSILADMLDDSGVFVIEAQNAFSVKKICREVLPDLLLISDGIPDFQPLVKWIKGNRTHFKYAIAVTAGGLSEGDRSAFDDVIMKPVTEGRLMTSLAGFLPTAKQGKQSESGLFMSEDGNDLQYQGFSFDKESKELILSYNGVVDFSYLDDVIRTLRDGTSGGNTSELADKLQFFMDNLEIENIKKLLDKLKMIVNVL